MTTPAVTTANTLATHATWWDTQRTWQASTIRPRRAQRRLLTDPIVAKLTLPCSEVEVQVYQPEPSWFYPVLGRLQHLSRLGEDWDSYGGSPPTDEAVFTALAVIARILRDESVAPPIVPLSEGGVQVEWHGEGEELEIRVNPLGEISAFRFDEQAGRAYEVDQVTLLDLSRLVALTGRR